MRSDTCAEPQNSARVSVSDCTSLVAMAGAKASCAPKLFFTMEDDEKLVELVGSHPVLYDLKHPLYKDQRVKDNVWKSIAEGVGRPIADCRRRWKNIKDTNDRRLRETNRTGSEAPSKKRKVWALQDRLSFLQTSEVKRGSFCNVTEEDEESDDPDDLLRESTPQLDTTPDNNTSVSEPNTNDVPREVDRHQPNSVQEVFSGNLNPNPNQPNKSTQPTKKKTNFRENLCMTIEKRSKERDKMIKELLSKEDESDDLDLFFKSICKTVRKFPAELQQRAKLETLTLVSNMELEVWATKTNSENLHIDLPSPSPSNESVSSGSGPSSGSVSLGYSPSPTLLRMIPPHEY